MWKTVCKFYGVHYIAAAVGSIVRDMEIQLGKVACDYLFAIVVYVRTRPPLTHKEGRLPPNTFLDFVERFFHCFWYLCVQYTFEYVNSVAGVCTCESSSPKKSPAPTQRSAKPSKRNIQTQHRTLAHHASADVQKGLTGQIRPLQVRLRWLLPTCATGTYFAPSPYVTRDDLLMLHRGRQSRRSSSIGRTFPLSRTSCSCRT